MNPIIYLARVTIEFTTGFRIGSGNPDTVSDSAVVVDANGLPTLPGRSIAGALRNEIRLFGSKPGGLRLNHDDDSESEVVSLAFGYQSTLKKGETYPAGQGSRLEVSFGVIHDSHNQPAEGLLLPTDIAKDPVLNDAANPAIRDHVRINHRGVVDGDGKFDERIVSPGHRFTFELYMEGTSSDKSLWGEILAIFKASRIRLGGGTRRGLGAFKHDRILARAFNLKDSKNDWDEWNKLGQNLRCAVSGQIQSLLPDYNETASTSPPVDLAFSISQMAASGYWMFGGGDNPEVDLSPVACNRITWQAVGNRTTGIVEAGWLIPESGIKGAIAHRTCFHANRIARAFADKLQPNKSISDHTGQNNPVVRELFGWASDDSKTDAGSPGRIIGDDLFVPLNHAPQTRINHVSIDQFTGGALPGFLFDEVPFWQGVLPEMKFVIRNPKPVSNASRQAFCAALDDLVSERLPLGAGANRGLGKFKANPECLRPVVAWAESAALAL